MMIRKFILASCFLALLLATANIYAASSAATAGKGVTAPDKEVAVLDTNFGQIVIGFYPGAAPNHVKNFKTLARKGFYDGTKFHRR